MDGIKITIIGGGKGGNALIDSLSLISSVKIKYIYDINPHPTAWANATARSIPCWFMSEQLDIILKDPSVDLILEVTGDPQMYHILDKRRLKSCRLIGGEETMILFHLLKAQQRATHALDLCRIELEERVRQRTKSLEQLNGQLLAKIAETEALNNSLQQINNTKTRYLLQATHQLKAPFAAILSYVEMILEGYCGPLNVELQGTLDKIKQRCVMLSTSIKEMLELANLKTYLKTNLVRHPVRIGNVIKEVLEENAARCARQHLNMLYSANQTGEDLIAVDPQQIHTLLSILIDNAINYSPDGSTITIALSHSQDDRLTLQIRDEGIGIPSAQIDKICQEYFRCNNAVNKHHNGSGLGLSIAHEIVRLHEFVMRFASEPGKGTTVVVEMPLAVRAPRPYQQNGYARSIGL